MKLANGIEILSLNKRLGRVRMKAPLGSMNVSASEELVTKLRAQGVVSQFFNFDNNQKKNDSFNFTRVEDVLPKDQDYIYVRFRAISKTLIDGYFLDFTQGNVLKESTPLLQGQTVYPNHDMFDINNWLGSVSQTIWDEAGDQFGGVAGINAEYKIDALMNPRIARGLIMDPPAIHSTSMTFLFEFEFSHPDLVEQGRFWQLLGDDVDGEIVRLIVTKVQEYWEASLVFQGADRFAKQIDDAAGGDGEDFADMKVPAPAELSAPPAEIPPANSNEERTMKLTNEHKQSLGIEFDGEDVPETKIFEAAEALAAKLKPFEGVDPENIAALQAKAAAGDKFIEKQRTEVVRLAKLAELGADAGDLPKVIKSTIDTASFDTLVELEDYYKGKVAEKFPQTVRSSEENSAEVDNAGGASAQKTAELPRVGVL
jgi:hypothetical protein